MLFLLINVFLRFKSSSSLTLPIKSHFWINTTEDLFTLLHSEHFVKKEYCLLWRSFTQYVKTITAISNKLSHILCQIAGPY